MNANTGRLSQALARALKSRGFKDLTPVQKAVLTMEPEGADALVSAPTGSGKTVAIGIALQSGLLGKGAAGFSIVITPTRDLANQIRRELGWLYRQTGISVRCCTGGVRIETEREVLGLGHDLIVATPGRLRDHFSRGNVLADRCGCVVLDEADEMLDMGFREDLDFILGRTPANCRTLMFSATISPAIEEVSNAYQRKRIRIDLGHVQATPTQLQGLVFPANRMEQAVGNVLRYHEPERAIVFSARRNSVSVLARELARRGFRLATLSGAMKQPEREEALAAMRSGRATVCVATDVAARGLDLPGLDLVLNVGLPGNATTLLHRIGRTGRAGRPGHAIIIVPPRDRSRADSQADEIGSAIEWTRPPCLEDILARDADRIVREAVFGEPGLDYDTHLAEALLEKYPPKRLALAFARHWRIRRPMPAILNDAPVGKDAGDQMQWLGIETGDLTPNEMAEILRLICRVGKVCKSDVGRIHVLEGSARFEVSRDLVQNFLAAAMAGENGPKVWHLPKRGKLSGPH